MGAAQTIAVFVFCLCVFAAVWQLQSGATSAGMVGDVSDIDARRYVDAFSRRVSAVEWAQAQGLQSGLQDPDDTEVNPVRHSAHHLSASKTQYEGRSEKWHLGASTAAHGTNRTRRAPSHNNRNPGHPSLDGASAHDLGGSTDERLARVKSAHQRRATRTNARNKGGDAHNMLVPWIAPEFQTSEARDWWDEDNNFEVDFIGDEDVM
jgi:hypothetical protein